MKDMIATFMLFFPSLLSIGPSTGLTGASAILISPLVFLIGVGLQYLFFQRWKLKWPELTLHWWPNMIFFIGLLILAVIFGSHEKARDSIFIGLWLGYGFSYITVLMVCTRIWLFFNPTKAFTWASILIMPFFIFPAFLLFFKAVATSALLGFYILWVWVYPGTVLYGTKFGFPGLLTLVVFTVLLVETWFVTKNKTKETTS